MRAVVLLAVLAGCAQDVEVPAGFAIEGYKSWKNVTHYCGAVAGHGDSHRNIFANDVARSHPRGSGRYPIGSIIVKEISARVAASGDCTAGEYRYTAVMRKVGDDTDLPTFHGWLFTHFSGDGAEEKHLDSCWTTCHKAGPYDGLWEEVGD